MDISQFFTTRVGAEFWTRDQTSALNLTLHSSPPGELSSSAITLFAKAGHPSAAETLRRYADAINRVNAELLAEALAAADRAEPSEAEAA